MPTLSIHHARGGGLTVRSPLPVPVTLLLPDTAAPEREAGVGEVGRSGLFGEVGIDLARSGRTRAWGAGPAEAITASECEAGEGPAKASQPHILVPKRSKVLGEGRGGVSSLAEAGCVPGARGGRDRFFRSSLFK